MILDYEKFRFKDENGEKEFFVEVNWSDDPKITECKVLRFTFPEGDVIYVKKEHLLSFLFAIGKPAEQRDLVPQKITRTKWYETVVSVKAKRDVQKGENITFPIKLSLPVTTEEIIAATKQTESGLFVPK